MTEHKPKKLFDYAPRPRRRTWIRNNLILIGLGLSLAACVAMFVVGFWTVVQ